MSAHPAFELRFAVRAVSGHRAATWKVWTLGGEKNDVYVACRGLGGQLKASLHQSGQWHVSFTKQFFEAQFIDLAVDPKKRFVETWPRPPEIAPGVTLAHRIVVPWNSPTTPTTNEPDNVIWIPPAAESHATEIYIVFTGPHVEDSGWPGKNGSSTALVGSFPIISGETVWVVYKEISFQYPTQEMKATGKFFGDASKKSLKSQTLRAVLFGNEPDGSRVMYDVPVQPKPLDG